MNPFHILTSYLFKIHFNIILSSAIGLPSDLFRSGFSIKHCVHFSSHNTIIKEKHSMVEDGDFEIEGYQGKCRNRNLPHTQKGGGIEPHFEM
jgi:hypothetical protein